MQPTKNSSARPSDGLKSATGVRSGTPGNRGVAGNRDVTRATQLINDTAHDIRSPLTGIRESIRIVHDGDVGELSREQRDFLSGAIENCDAIEQLVDQLVQFDTEHSITTGKTRSWMTIDRLMQMMGRSLDAWAIGRGISIQIDPQASASIQIYVDAHGLIRLVSNLVQNAARASRGSQNVLIRFAPNASGDSLVWSVVDRGVGMSAEELRQVTQRGVSLSGGSGLGLSICQDLAATHHSTLQIRSRVGSGTTIQFQTPAGSPASVAAAYARWRLAVRGPKTKPRRRPSPDQINPPEFRVDGPDMSAAGGSGSNSSAAVELDSMVELKVGQKRPMVPGRAMIGTLHVGAMVPREVAMQVSEVMPRAIGYFDFVEPISENTFVYAIDETRQRFADRTDQIDAKILRRLPQARLQWSDPQEASIDDHRWVTRFTDLAVRCHLMTDRRENAVAIIDESRLGSDEIGPSEVAASRLEEELRHMGSRMRSQNAAIRNQTKKLMR